MTMVVLASIMVIAGLIVWHFRSSKSPHRDIAPSSATGNASSLLSDVPIRAGKQTASNASSPVKARVERVTDEPSRRDPEFLVNALSHTPKRLSTEDLDQLDHDLRSLVALGVEAIPSIRDYLNEFEDIPLTSSDLEKPAPYPSLRLALLDVLRQIGGPEAIEVELEVLEQTTEPREIAFLGAALEEQAPGQYIDKLLNSAFEVLGMAVEKQLPGPELAPIFKFLGSQSDDTTITALEESLPAWERYAMMSLASAPEGKGIPSIVNQLQNAVTNQDRALEEFSWEMLAQVGHENAVAREYLLEAAKLNAIPDDLWEAIAAYAAGTTSYQMERPVHTDPNVRERFTSHRFSKDDGLQGAQLIFKWRPRPSSIRDQLTARTEFVDALISSTSNAQAQRLLRAALTYQ